MITISPASAADAPAIATVLDEMDRFYGATSTDPLDQHIRQINEPSSPTRPRRTRYWNEKEPSSSASPPTRS